MNQKHKEDKRRAFLNYNKRRHLELVKLKYSPEKLITQQESSELSDYAILMDTKLSLESSDQYLQLIEELLKGKFNLLEFCTEFWENEERIRKIFTILESNFVLLSPNELSLDFSDLILDIYGYCLLYEEDLEYSSEEEYKPLEAKYRNAIKNVYLKLQKTLSEK